MIENYKKLYHDYYSMNYHSIRIGLNLKCQHFWNLLVVQTRWDKLLVKSPFFCHFSVTHFHIWAVIPINGTSVLMAILQEKQKTNSGSNQAPYDNKTITKNVQNCVAHLLVAFKGQICAFQHQKFNKNCLLCQSSIYFLWLALMNHELNFGISVTF